VHCEASSESKPQPWQRFSFPFEGVRKASMVPSTEIGETHSGAWHFQQVLVEICRAFVDEKSSGHLLNKLGLALEKHHFQVAILGVESEKVFPRFVSKAFESFTAATNFLGSRRKPLTIPLDAGPLFIEDLPAFLHRMLETLGENVELSCSFHTRAVSLPISVRGSPFALLICAAENLSRDFIPTFELLGRYIETALGLCGERESVQGREATLVLMRELALAPPGMNWVDLGKTVLDVLLAETASTAGIIFRYEANSDCFESVATRAFTNQDFFSEFERVHPTYAARMKTRFASRPTHPAAIRNGLEQVASVPLRVDGVLVGALSLARTDNRPYTEEDLQTIELLGTQVAALLERARLQNESLNLYQQLKASFEQLERSQAESVRNARLAAVGELAAVMAHEVRNPLAVIYNSLVTLQKRPMPLDEEVLFGAMREEADKLNRIVSDLLDFVRPFEVNAANIEIDPLINSAAQAALVGFGPKWTIDKMNVPTDIWFLTDAHLLKMALVNLFINGLQSMPLGGSVEIAAGMLESKAERVLSISVSDRGAGISSEGRARIFEPFYTTKATGVGLGLAVVKRIAEAHGGEVLVESLEGQGTTFILNLSESKLLKITKQLA
jgi:signal transduction histidine kinase